MLLPRVLAPRGVYEAAFYIRPGVLALYAVTRAGLLAGMRHVETEAEYLAAYDELTAALDAADPPLRLVE